MSDSGSGKGGSRPPAGIATMVPVYLPSLLEVLRAAERKKGAPLTKHEVLEARDTATVMMLSPERAEAIASQRGPDIDPADCWTQWQQVRSLRG